MPRQLIVMMGVMAILIALGHVALQPNPHIVFDIPPHIKIILEAVEAMEVPDK